MNILKTKLAKQITLAGAGILFLAANLILFNNYTSLFSFRGDFAVESDSTRVEIEIRKPQILYGMVVNDLQ